MKKQLALLGGTPTVEYSKSPEAIFRWPIVTQEDRDACMRVIDENKFSGLDITAKFQQEFAEWQGTKYAVAYPNGTMSLAAAMFGVGLGMGDEMICPTKTYWASAVAALPLGATVVFCDIGRDLNMDPDDIERCIGPKTKAIMVVHYCAYPCDMDRIMAIAKKHNLKVIEDVSHAQGSVYKGRKCGTFGDVAAMSMMSGKSFAAGELGMLVTNDKNIYERSLAYAHYSQNNPTNVTSPELTPYHSIALGGVKGRANQLCVELARGQLKHYDERVAEIDRSMNYFCDKIGDVPGLHPIRPAKDSGSSNGAWYIPQSYYVPEELHGLTSGRFSEALRAETGGYPFWEGGNYPLHNHEYFKTFDFFGIGKPTRIAFADRDVRELDADIKNADKIKCVSLPRFVKFMPEVIDRYVEAIQNVIENHEQLIESNDKSDNGGRWYGTTNK